MRKRGKNKRFKLKIGRFFNELNMVVVVKGGRFYWCLRGLRYMGLDGLL